MAPSKICAMVVVASALASGRADASLTFEVTGKTRAYYYESSGSLDAPPPDAIAIGTAYVARISFDDQQAASLTLPGRADYYSLAITIEIAVGTRNFLVSGAIPLYSQNDSFAQVFDGYGSPDDFDTYYLQAGSHQSDGPLTMGESARLFLGDYSAAGLGSTALAGVVPDFSKFADRVVGYSSTQMDGFLGWNGSRQEMFEGSVESLRVLPTVTTTPEPSTLATGLMAVLANLGLVGWRRRKVKASA